MAKQSPVDKMAHVLRAHGYTRDMRDDYNASGGRSYALYRKPGGFTASLDISSGHGNGRVTLHGNPPQSEHWTDAKALDKYFTRQFAGLAEAEAKGALWAPAGPMGVGPQYRDKPWAPGMPVHYVVRAALESFVSSGERTKSRLDGLVQHWAGVYNEPSVVNLQAEAWAVFYYQGGRFEPAPYVSLPWQPPVGMGNTCPPCTVAGMGAAVTYPQHLPQDIRPGDLVDFGPYGRLYVVRRRGDEDFWVTPVAADRHNLDASGRIIMQALALRIIERGGRADWGGT